EEGGGADRLVGAEEGRGGGGRGPGRAGGRVTAGTAAAVAGRHSRRVSLAIFRGSTWSLRPVRRGGILAALLLGGCAGLQDLFKEPDVHLQRVVVQSVGLTGGTLNLIVGVYNPNPFDVQGTKLNLGLDVEQ